MNRSALIALALLLVGCSPERRLQRLLALNQHLSRVDTITIHDTVVVPGDTVERASWLTDTITIESERQVIRVVRIPTGSPCDTAAVLIHATGIVKPDTVYRTIEIPVERVAPLRIERRAPWWMWLIVAALTAAVIAQSLRR